VGGNKRRESLGGVSEVHYRLRGGWVFRLSKTCRELREVKKGRREEDGSRCDSKAGKNGAHYTSSIEDVSGEKI